MRRAPTLLGTVVLGMLWAVPATAQTGSSPLDQAAAALRRDPVFVDQTAELAIDPPAADRLRQRIRERGAPVFIAVLPASATTEVGNVNQLPMELGRRTGLTGTYGVVAGRSFRAASNALAGGRAGAAATAAFQAHSSQGAEAVLVDFVDRVAATPSPRDTSRQPVDDGRPRSRDGGGASSVLPIVLLLGAGGAGLYFWQRGRSRRRAVDATAELGRDRRLLQAELTVLAQDVVGLQPQVDLHPEARPDYDAGVARYRVAEAALEEADDRLDLDRVERVIREGEYAMSRARSRIDGREPPPPPPELARPGRSNEPALDVDERGQPTYVGYASPFYGGGWFGAGGGLFTGLLLGQMLGGGWGDDVIYVDDRDSYGGGDLGGGDLGGGDFGGGDFGGGDFGGGDAGGGDW